MAEAGKYDVLSDSESSDISSDLSEHSHESVDIDFEEEQQERHHIGVFPYRFEPEYDSDDPDRDMVVEVENEGENDDERRLTDLNYWCQCGKCQLMETALECKCCQSTNIVQQKLEDPDIENAHFMCVTEHPGFDGVCLNLWALEVAFLTYRANHGNLPVNGPNHEKYRYVAYRQFVRWCWGYLGKKNRVVIPSCVIVAIRNAFQSQTYKGFKLPDLNN